MERSHSTTVHDRNDQRDRAIRSMKSIPSHRTPMHRASSFSLESLEPRVLMSADLAIAVQTSADIVDANVAATVSLVGPTSTPSATIQTASITSPHLPSLQIADFGRAYNENESGDPWSPSRTEAAVQWFAQHVDMTEQQNVLPRLRQHNPTLQSWVYALDLYQFQHEVSSLPESSFLHVSEPTSVTLKDINGSPLADYTIPTGGRLEVSVWLNKFWPFNLKDASLRAYNSQRILNLIGSEAGVFLDAHGPTFSDTFKVGPLTSINYGGGIQEYGGRRPGDPTLEAEYNADVVNWLSQLQKDLAAAGKWGVVNAGTDFAYSQNARDQAIAMNGFETEFLITPNALKGAHSVQTLYDLTQRVTMNGGTAILSGQWAYIPGTYTPGSYDSAEARQDMWRLAFYYLVKQPAGSTGTAYFDLSLQSYATNNVPGDLAEWHAAYQVDLGQPTSGMTVAKSGISPSDDAPYTVFTRSYGRGQVLFRAMDQWSSTDYGDASAVTIALNGNFRQLKEDGSVGSVTNSVQVRNGEALILLHESGATSTVVQNNTVPAPAVNTPPLQVPISGSVTTQPTPAPNNSSPPDTNSRAWTVAEMLALPFVPNAPLSTVSNVPTPVIPAPAVVETPPSSPQSFTVAEMLAFNWPPFSKQ